MNRYDNTVSTTQPTMTAIEDGPASHVYGALTYSTGAGLAVIVAGALFLLAANNLIWDSYRFVVLLAALPLGIVATLLVVASLRYSVTMLEGITGLDLDRDGVVGDVPDVRIIPYRGPSHTIDGVAPDDLRQFVHTITSTGDWTQNSWRGVQLASGKKCDNDYHGAMCAVLKKTGVIVGSGPRVSGNLTTTDADEILRLLGLNELN